MSYATVDDVQTRLPGFSINASSKPSTAEVAGTIAEVEGEINGVLIAQGYPTVPATGENDVAMLRGYVSRKAAAEAWMDAHEESELDGRIKRWLDGWDKFIARMRRGEQHLVDQLPQGDTEAVFGIVRTPTRDDTFTERWGTTDWDE